MPGKVPWDGILALQQAHGARPWLSVCPEAEREQLQAGRADGWTRGGERGKQAVTPRSPVPARGGAVLSISWPAEPSHPKNLPRHHRLPKERERSARHIPAPSLAGSGEGRGQRWGRTHICDAFRGHPASGQPGHSPASSRPAPGGERCHITRQKSPPHPSRSCYRARKKETALPTAALFTKSWFQALGRIAGAFQGPVSTRLTHTIYRSPQFSQSFPRDLSRNSLPRVSAASSKEARAAPAPPGFP